MISALWNSIPSVAASIAALYLVSVLVALGRDLWAVRRRQRPTAPDHHVPLGILIVGHLAGLVSAGLTARIFAPGLEIIFWPIAAVALASAAPPGRRIVISVSVAVLAWTMVAFLDASLIRPPLKPDGFIAVVLEDERHGLVRDKVVWGTVVTLFGVVAATLWLRYVKRERAVQQVL